MDAKATLRRISKLTVLMAALGAAPAFANNDIFITYWSQSCGEANCPPSAVCTKAACAGLPTLPAIRPTSAVKATFIAEGRWLAQFGDRTYFVDIIEIGGFSAVAPSMTAEAESPSPLSGVRRQVRGTERPRPQPVSSVGE